MQSGDDSWQFRDHGVVVVNKDSRFYRMVIQPADMGYGWCLVMIIQTKAVHNDEPTINHD